MKNEKRTGLLRKYSKKIPPKSHKPNSLQKIELKKIELKSSIQRCTELVNLSRAVPYKAVQYSTGLYKSIQNSSEPHNICNTVQCHTENHSTVLECTGVFSTVQYGEVWYSTVQCGTDLSNTAH